MMNTFVVYNCKKRKNILITQSARKAKYQLCTGIKIEVWSGNELIETIYARKSNSMNKYITMQKQHIREKQTKAEEKNQRRKEKLMRKRMEENGL